MKLQATVPGGNISMLKHLEQVFKTTKVKPPELESLGECPEELYYLWLWFCELTNCVSEITFSEIESWSRLTKKKIKSWEVIELMKLFKLLRLQHG